MESNPGFSGDPDFPALSSDRTKTRDILEQYIKDSQNTRAENAIAYTYRDTDTLSRELAELYSYSEEKDFMLNVRAFEDLLIQFNLPPSWRLLSNQQKQDTIFRLLDQLETNDPEARMSASRCILYIAQGCWADVHSVNEQIESVKAHVILLFRLGTFAAFVDLLKIEVEKFHYYKQISRGDSEKLRVILAVLYTITEILRNEKECGRSVYESDAEAFRFELLMPVGGEILIITLLDLMVRFSDCNTDSSNFPIKKLLLLVWKLLLVALGGLKHLEKTKRKKRINSGLPPQHDSTETREYIYDLTQHFNFLKSKTEDTVGNSPRQNGHHIKVKQRPKVRKEDHDQFLNDLRIKFIGYSLTDDHTTTAGLPFPLHDSIETIRKHIYVPLSKVHIDKEKKVKSHPFSNPDVIKMTTPEILYQHLFPNLKEYILSLTKILLLVVPNNEQKTYKCQPEISGIPRDSVIYSIALNVDMFRHQEIILKAVSAIILLLLKHLKVNNVYQFEYTCQCLVFNNSIPILMSFFNQNISAYVRTLNEIPALDFPSCIIEYQLEITIDSLNLTNSDSFSSRNMFLCINLLRILNKITKWKPARITQLVLVDSKTVLSRLLLVNNETLKLYALKLLKMQMRYLGKTWRKNNIKVLTEIYLNVRLHLNDNFLNHSSVQKFKTNPTKNKDEIVLKNDIDLFNKRRYKNIPKQNDVSTDNCTRTMSRANWKLPECLKKLLNHCLEQEVLS